MMLAGCTGIVGDGLATDDAPVPSMAGGKAGNASDGKGAQSGRATCEGSDCVCEAPSESCEGACVDTRSDARHCGTCGLACEAGQTCQQGMCACGPGQTSCNDRCTDVQTSEDHCGACNTPCGNGQTCVDGACTCASGQTSCGGACVDTRSSDAHCGACGLVCAAGERCGAGQCAAIVGEDGCGGTAKGVSLEQIAIYQSVKIPVMEGGAAVASGARKADVVAGRETLFRVYVKVAAGFVPRQLSARLTLRNGTQTTQYFAKANVSKASVDLEPATTFQLPVAAAHVTPETTFSVELVECATGSGELAAPRFPATGEVALQARPAGGMKIKIIPLQANGKRPDVSSGALEGYRQLLVAMLPITQADFTVGNVVQVSAPIDWPAVLDRLRVLRANEAAPADVYYYGLLMPQDTLASFCGNACTTGIGYVANANAASLRVALGVGFADRVSAEVMAHELGHTMGRNHAPCVRGGSIEGVDGMFPYPNGAIGSMGYDARRKAFLFGDRNTDIMGYCNNKWISDYTYKYMTDRVASVNALRAQFVQAAALAAYRVLLLDGRGPRWGTPLARPALPEGDVMAAEALDVSGAPVATIEVYRTLISEGGGAMFMVPPPKAGWHAVQVPGAAPLAF